ncbi:MAG: hypothetical protein FJ221_03715 [Lentisphaerae bacterium]|nr:hypothetical protein [Lentisphaerota bacterium]
MKTIRIALPVLLVAAAACPAQTNTADHFMGLGATFFDTLSVAGGQVGPSNSLAFGQATAAGQYSIALGYGAYAQHDRAFVWAGSSETGMASTTPGQFVVYAPGGIHLLGGTIHGNGSTLTGINASNLVGLGSAALKPYNYYARASAATTAINASNLADSANRKADVANSKANSAYNTASSALQSDGRIDWTGTQNAAGQSLTNLQSAYAYALTQGTFQVTINRMTGLNVLDPYGYGFPYSGVYRGDPTNGFFGAASIVRDATWNWTITWPLIEFVPLQLWYGSGGFYLNGWPVSYYVTYENGYPTSLDLTGNSPYDGKYYGDSCWGYTREDGAYSISGDGSGSLWWMTLTEVVCLGSYGEGSTPSGSFYGGYNGWSFSVEPYYEDVTRDETRPVTNAIPFEIADGRHAWVGVHDAGGHALTNLSLATARTVAPVSHLVTTNLHERTFIRVMDSYGPYEGVYERSSLGCFASVDGNGHVLIQAPGYGTPYDWVLWDSSDCAVARPMYVNGPDDPCGTWYDASSYYFTVQSFTSNVEEIVSTPQYAQVAYSTADGRHEWVGNHNAGGFDLGNVGTLQAQVVVGDGAGLFNVGLAALNVASVDLRYLLKAGDTVAGDLEVNGALTVGGRPVATLTSIPPQGDISMGSFTNAPPQP